jgi:hypothetical protein
MTNYNPDIPQTGDNLSTSQGQILNNFTMLNTVFGVDHYPFNFATTGQQGMHEQVTMPTTTTHGATSGLASVFFSKDVANVAAPYFSNSAGSQALWNGGSGNGQTTQSFGGNKSSGYIKFPNGFIIQWGNNTQVSGDTITFPIAFPNACFEVVPSIFRSIPGTGIVVYVANITAANWTVNTPSGTIGISWIAVGN